MDWIGLDWVIKLLDWVGLDLAKWTHVQLGPCRSAKLTQLGQNERPRLKDVSF